MAHNPFLHAVVYSISTDLYAPGLFLVNNYKQALDILSTEPALKKQMQDQQIYTPTIFDKWLSKEREYLQGLRKEPMQETLLMEYWQKLVNLSHSQYVYFTTFWSHV